MIFEKIKKNLLNCDSDDNEDLVVIALLDTLKSKKIDYLEVGSGLCRFPKKLFKLYNNLNITCLEINSQLANMAELSGFNVVNENFLENSIASSSFDVVQCSHVIEHFPYPQVTKVIDELLRITKKDGYLIIRTPLLWKFFYYDIDHVRPYPPQSILNYLYYEQQQKKGQNEVEVINIWYRTTPVSYNYLSSNKVLFHIRLFRGIINRCILVMNKINIFLWNRFRFPGSAPNGYVMILKKKS